MVHLVLVNPRRRCSRLNSCVWGVRLSKGKYGGLRWPGEARVVALRYVRVQGMR